MIGFIYKTTCLVNGKIYIGRHEGIEEDNYLGSGKIFKLALCKYGKENFKREILRLCETLHELEIWEHVYIKKYHSQEPTIGYNVASGNVNSSKYNPSKLPEVRNKIKKALTGRKATNETKRKMSDSSPRRKWTEEQKLNLSKKMSGRKFTKEHKQKLRESKLGKSGKLSNSWGKKWTEEQRKKSSESHKGQISAMKGKHHSEESRKKMSISQKKRFSIVDNHPMKGKHHSKETKMKISESRKNVSAKNCKHDCKNFQR